MNPTRKIIQEMVATKLSNRKLAINWMKANHPGLDNLSPIEYIKNRKDLVKLINLIDDL